ncbi:MAG: 30S ribosomal protein S16 [Fuerstiella sp.]|nr:30S ribosomal protein S16 [Fuerstiella sp.]
MPDKSKRVSLKMDRIDYWLSVGAQPSEKVNALIKKVQKGDFGTALAPPPMQAPKQPEAPAAEEAPAEAPDTTEAVAEEAPAAEGGE